jgi:DNA phosphorothioation-dependent restriction protein DptH
MAKRITPEQRDKVISMLRESVDRVAIASALGVTVGQVSAIAAHLTMKTYEERKSIEDPVETRPAPSPVSNESTPLVVANSNGPLEIPIGPDVDTRQQWSWSPTPERGTPNPHLLIVGESGSGKTYATQCICAELVQSHLPTIVFDFGQGFVLNTLPEEFLAFAKPIEINVGRDGININPLQIFPSDIHGPINVAQRIADTFARVYPAIGVQQHALLRDAVIRTFEDAGIDPKDKKTWVQHQPPRFNELKLALDSIAKDKDDPGRRYAAAVASHISTVFVFNTFRATGLDLDWGKILSAEAMTYIVQLKGLEHLLERIVTELLLWNLVGYVESLGPGPLRCVILLDEAHRLSFASNSPVEKLLREGRKFGLGVVLASQQPEDFSPVAFTNTASKLIFNVTDERGAVARQIARKSSGDAKFLSLTRRLGSLPRGKACFLTGDRAGIVEISDFVSRAERWQRLSG